MRALQAKSTSFRRRVPTAGGKSSNFSTQRAHAPQVVHFTTPSAAALISIRAAHSQHNHRDSHMRACVYGVCVSELNVFAYIVRVCAACWKLCAPLVGRVDV